jgi:hypothetical protein
LVTPVDPIDFLHETTWSALPAEVRHQATRCLAPPDMLPELLTELAP